MQRVITPDQKVVVLNEDGTWKYSSPVGSMLEKLKSLALSANIVEMFKGLFERLGVQVIDTGEAFTCIHHGNRIEFASGVKETEVDFIVKVYAFQLERLAEPGRGNRLRFVPALRTLWAVYVELPDLYGSGR